MTFTNAFLTDLYTEIFPVYIHHEESFDFVGIHGRMHISRALIFAEFMTCYHAEVLNNKNLDNAAIRYAVAFHDSGRQGNGHDIWENDSAAKCAAYLLGKPEFSSNPEYCNYVGSLVHKHGEWDMNKKIVHDADVLEIMRPCCGHGGIGGFQHHALRFLSRKDDFIDYDKNPAHFDGIRQKLINEAWELIYYTEQQKHNFKENNHIESFLEIIQNNPYKYHLLEILT